jgi:hypothetical protein
MVTSGAANRASGGTAARSSPSVSNSVGRQRAAASQRAAGLIKNTMQGPGPTSPGIGRVPVPGGVVPNIPGVPRGGKTPIGGILPANLRKAPYGRRQRYLGPLPGQKGYGTKNNSFFNRVPRTSVTAQHLSTTPDMLRRIVAARFGYR